MGDDTVAADGVVVSDGVTGTSFVQGALGWCTLLSLGLSGA
jgi:hypothetical protein